jgi:pyridoxal phosphate enzyme (YggS family)
MSSPAEAARLASRRAEVLSRIARAAEEAGRDPAGIALLAVTKGHPAATVAAAAAAGFTLFGENRVQEGAAKIAALSPRPPGLSFHLIGPLQTNKAKPALQYFDVVESLDRERLADRLESLLEATDRRLPVLLEVNLGGEATKSGVSPEGLPDLALAAIARPHLDVRGLMAVPPFAEDPEASRPHFRALRTLRDRLRDRLGRELPELSMGMSHDYEIAIAEGATRVRLGTVLFGPREA